jgi:hypothetical protein
MTLFDGGTNQIYHHGRVLGSRDPGNQMISSSGVKACVLGLVTSLRSNLTNRWYSLLTPEH